MRTSAAAQPVVGGAVSVGAAAKPGPRASSPIFRRIIIYGSIVVFGAFAVMLAVLFSLTPTRRTRPRPRRRRARRRRCPPHQLRYGPHRRQLPRHPLPVRRWRPALRRHQRLHHRRGHRRHPDQRHPPILPGAGALGPRHSERRFRRARFGTPIQTPWPSRRARARHGFRP